MVATISYYFYGTTETSKTSQSELLTNQANIETQQTSKVFKIQQMSYQMKKIIRLV